MKTKIHTISSVIFTVVLLLTFVSQAGADYQSEVLEDNPLVYLRFEDPVMSEGSGAADLGSLNKGGTYRGNSIIPVSSAPGLSQAAYLTQDPNSVGDYINVSDFDLALNLTDVTYEMWFVCDDEITTWSRLFQHNGDWLMEGSPGVMVNSGIAVPPGNYGVMGGDSTDYIYGTTDDGNWHHVVVTYDSGASVLKELYVDSVSMGTAVGPNDLWYDYDQILIGAGGNMYWLENLLYGAVDEFAIYEGVLGADRVEAHYDAGIVPEPATVLLLGLGGLAVIRKRRV